VTRALRFLMIVAALAGALVQAAPSRLRIVSLAPHLTELVFAAGAGDMLVGVVEYSDYPEAARSLPRVGDAWRVDMERLLLLEPDIVLTWASGTPEDVIERLDALKLAHREISTFRLADVPVALRTIGEIAGTSQVAGTAAADFEREVAQLRRSYGGAPPLSVFIQLDDQPLYTVNGRHIISEVVELCGGHNVFASLPQLAPPVSLEAVIAADPDVIVSTDDTIGDAMGMWRRWTRLKAVDAGAVYSLPADTMARATPRLVSGTRATCAALDDARRRLAARGHALN
jgi:iron complex transport system substrate-binding protein